MTDQSSMDTRSFRDVLGTFATGVTIVTAQSPTGEPIGLTANSFNSVSLDPPMILWSLAKSSRSLQAFEVAQYWAVHILAADQDALSTRFARSGGEKFAGLAYESGLGGIPLLSGCVARLQCKTAYRYDGGDHVIFVGEVLDFDHRNAPTLVFQRGKYALAAPMAKPELLSGTEPRQSDVSAGEDFLGYLLWRAHRHFQLRVAPHLESAGLDAESFMVLAMLLHHDGRSVEQLASGLRLSGPARAGQRAEALVARALVRLDVSGPTSQYWLTDAGREVTLQIHAASRAIEDELLERMDSSEGAALKHLLRQFILRTDPGIPHPWQTDPFSDRAGA